jgi:hypothetical protein
MALLDADRDGRVRARQTEVVGRRKQTRVGGTRVCLAVSLFARILIRRARVSRN